MMSSYTEKLIELVKGYPLLYDLQNNDHKNNRKTEKAWDAIAVALNDELGGNNAKNRFKSVRDSFSRCIRLNQTKSGQGASFRVKWTYWDQMQFFRPFMTFASTSSNVKKKPIAAQQSQEKENIDPDNDPQIIADDADDLTDNPTNTQQQSGPKSPSKKKKKKNNAPTSADRLVTYFENKKKMELDDIELVFVGHAKTIKKFSARRQIHAKFRVAEILKEQELIDLNEKEEGKELAATIRRSVVAIRPEQELQDLAVKETDKEPVATTRPRVESPALSRKSYQQKLTATPSPKGLQDKQQCSTSTGKSTIRSSNRVGKPQRTLSIDFSSLVDEDAFDQQMALFNRQIEDFEREFPTSEKSCESDEGRELEAAAPQTAADYLRKFINE